MREAISLICKDCGKDLLVGQLPAGNGIWNDAHLYTSEPQRSDFIRFIFEHEGHNLTFIADSFEDKLDAMKVGTGAMKQYNGPPILATVADVMARLAANFNAPAIGMVIVFWADGRVTAIIDGREQPDHIAADAARMIGPRERDFIKRLCIEVPSNLLHWPIALVDARTGFMQISAKEVG